MYIMYIIHVMSIVPGGDAMTPAADGRSTDGSTVTAAARTAGGRSGYGAETPSFGRLLANELLHAMRRGGTVFCTLLLGPIYVVAAGVLFGTTLVIPIGGFGLPDPSVVSFPAVVIVAYGLLLTPVDLLGRRASGELERFVDRPIRSWGADLVARLILVLTGVVLTYAIGMVGFGVRPGAGTGTAVVTLLAAALGAAAFLAVGQLIALVLTSVRAARVLGHLLLCPLLLVSGAVIPTSMLPDVVRFAGFVPSTRLVDLLRRTWLAEGITQTWLSILVLVSTFVIAAWLVLLRSRALRANG